MHTVDLIGYSSYKVIHNGTKLRYLAIDHELMNKL